MFGKEQGEPAPKVGSSNVDDLAVFHAIVTSLSSMDSEEQVRVLQSVITWLKLESEFSGRGNVRGPARTRSTTDEAPHSFAPGDEQSPKEFVLEKVPRTDVERVACLAYYLTHYRDVPHFKTLDISKLNIEAAQAKFANAAQAVKNATNSGLLAPVARGKKQLSAAGEQFVQALPDREEAKAALTMFRSRKNRRPKSKKKSTKNQKADSKE